MQKDQEYKEISSCVIVSHLFDQIILEWAVYNYSVSKMPISCALDRNMCCL